MVVSGVSSVFAAVLSVALAASSQADAPAAAGVTGSGTIKRDPFPRHDELEEQVAFWRNVYGYWGLQQVALHDMDYPGVIYEVVDLPGPAADGYTSEQKKFIDKHRDDLKARLQSLEQRYKQPELLTDGDRELLYRMYQGAGKEIVAGAAERVRSQRGLRERFSRGVEISGRYESTFRDIFRKEGLPTDLAYLPHVESSFQAHARSSAGAVGIWQFTRSAGRLFLKVNAAVDERLDPVASARGAARYLRRSHDTFNDWAFAVTSYNHGVGGMLRAQKQFDGDFARVVREYQSRSFGFASRNFYTEFLAARDVAGNHADFFPEGLRIEPPLQAQTVVLDRNTSAVQLARAYGVSLKELASSNPAWSQRAVRGELPLPAGVEIWLPARSPAPVVTARVREDVSPQFDAAAQPAVSRNYHVVRRNDTLYSVSRRYGIDIVTLRRLNGMGAKDHVVKVGQKLLVVDVQEAPSDVAAVPARAVEEDTHVIHVVRKGETAFDIAASYGISLSTLLHTNDLNRHSVIYPGQKFLIPRQ